MADIISEFGERVAGATYRLRPGGYAVVRNETREIAVLVTSTGLFLPGGGQDHDETPGAAAMREAHEECGFRIRLEAQIGVADEFVVSADDGVHYRKRCTFFVAQLVEIDPRAHPEDEVEWMAPRDAALGLSHGSQRWAVTQLLSHPGTAPRSIS